MYSVIMMANEISYTPITITSNRADRIRAYRNIERVIRQLLPIGTPAGEARRISMTLECDAELSEIRAAVRGNS